MLLTTGMVALLAGLRFAAGLIIGAITAVVMYRRLITMARTSRASLAAAIAFLLISGVAGWAGAHAAFENGKRVDISPSGEDLRFRNAIANNETLLCVIGSIAFAALANVGTRDRSL